MSTVQSETGSLHPYLKDPAIKKVWEYLETYRRYAKFEMQQGQEMVAHAQAELEKLNDRDPVKSLAVQLDKLPISTCPLCGGKVIDRSALIDVIKQFRFYEPAHWTFDHTVWPDEFVYDHFRTLPHSGADADYTPVCLHCGAYRVATSEYERMASRSWQRVDEPKKNFASKVFGTLPAVQTVSRYNVRCTWFFVLENTDIWRMDGRKQEVADRLGIGV